VFFRSVFLDYYTILHVKESASFRVVRGISLENLSTSFVTKSQTLNIPYSVTSQVQVER
jgi:hypothetical protein